MNLADLTVLVIILGCVLFLSYKGLVMAVFNTVSVFISMFLSNMLYPKVTEILRGQPGIYNPVKDVIAEKIGLDALSDGGAAGAGIIESLNLPEFLKRMLSDNNKPDIHDMLNAGTIQDYISGFLANIFFSVAAMILIFALIFIAMKIIAVILDLASRLPVINTLNKIGGALLGLLVGCMAVSALLALLSVMLTSDKYADIIIVIEGSKIAKFFYENNIIMVLISQIFK